jgi:hypothetical protein
MSLTFALMRSLRKMKTLPVTVMFSFLALWPVCARDDGRFSDSYLHTWFDHLMSGRGFCCSFADGVTIQDVDWDTHDGKYRVRLHGEWVTVPEDAVITEPNLYGPAVIWPYMAFDGTLQVRCFLPGAGL